MKIAITGGIGSGKSYVCRLLAQRGISIYDCDSAAKRLMSTSEQLRQQLTSLIGPDAYVDGTLNKAAVAAFLLQSQAHAHAIDAIVHPAVANDFEQSGCQWMECAILYESGFDKLVDRVVVVKTHSGMILCQHSYVHVLHYLLNSVIKIEFLPDGKQKNGANMIGKKSFAM